MFLFLYHFVTFCESCGNEIFFVLIGKKALKYVKMAYTNKNKYSPINLKVDCIFLEKIALIYAF